MRADAAVVPPMFPLILHRDSCRCRRRRNDRERAGAREDAFIAPLPSHVPPVLSADLEQGAGDLPERAAAHRFHQDREDVLLADHRIA